MGGSKWELVGVGGNKWELVGVGGSAWEWVGAQFSINHFTINFFFTSHTHLVRIYILRLLDSQGTPCWKQAQYRTNNCLHLKQTLNHLVKVGECFITN